MVRAILDAVDGGVAHVDVRGGHVDLRAQHAGTLRELAVLHAQEKIHVLLGRAVAIGGIFARLGQRAAVFADFLLGEVVHIRQPAADEVERKFINLVVLLGGIVDVGIIEAEPVDIVLDGLDKFFFFLGRVGIVKAQVAHAAEALRRQKIDGKRLDMADVQIAVRFGREARLNAAAVLALGDIGLDGLPNKVGLFPGLFCHGNPSLKLLHLMSIHNRTVYYTRRRKTRPTLKYWSFRQKKTRFPDDLRKRGRSCAGRSRFLTPCEKIREKCSFLHGGCAIMNRWLL